MFSSDTIRYISSEVASDLPESEENENGVSRSLRMAEKQDPSPPLYDPFCCTQLI